MKDFLACTELVTLVHHVKTADSDSYVCYPIQGVSWYAKTETAVTADGAKAANVYKVRIPEAVLPSCLPEKLDYLVKGEISGVLKPADLKCGGEWRMSFGIKIKSVNITPSKILAKHGLGGDNKARKYLATSVAKYCDPYVPMSAGAGAHLKNQKQIAPDGSKVTYPGPYAHYVYVGLAMVGRAPKSYSGRALNYHGAPMRGKEWDKRMLADRGGDLKRDFAAYVGGRAK